MCKERNTNTFKIHIIMNFQDSSWSGFNVLSTLDKKNWHVIYKLT